MTRDELIERLEDKGWHRLWPVDAIIDALDALNQGPKRVAELEGALQNLADEYDNPYLEHEGPAREAARAALKGQDNG
jgi:hypothetical protein